MLPQIIRRERIYILMLLFILAINILNAGQREEKKVYQKKEVFSTKSFKEIGITEEKVRDFFESDRLSSRLFKYGIFGGIILFSLSLISNVIFIFHGKRTELDFKSSPAPVSWGVMDLLKVSIIIVFIGYIIGFIETFFIKTFHIHMGMNLRMILGTFFIDITAGIVILYFVTVKYKQRLQILGLKFTHFFRNICSGITTYIFILPLLLVILLLSIWFLNLIGYTPPPQPVLEVFMEERRSTVLLFLSIFVSVFGPVIEEMFFRGFMYTAIKKHLGVGISAFLTASIFSLLHTNIVGFLPIMTLGLLLVYLYETTGSLIPSITVHILHNSIIVSFVFLIKELAR